MHPSSSSAVIHRRSKTPSLPSILILTTAPDSPTTTHHHGLGIVSELLLCPCWQSHLQPLRWIQITNQNRRTSDVPRNQVRVAYSGGSCHGRLWRNHASHIKIRLCVYFWLTFVFCLFFSTQNIPPFFFFSFLSYSHLFATLNLFISISFGLCE